MIQVEKDPNPTQVGFIKLVGLTTARRWSRAALRLGLIFCFLVFLAACAFPQPAPVENPSPTLALEATDSPVPESTASPQAASPTESLTSTPENLAQEQAPQAQEELHSPTQAEPASVTSSTPRPSPSPEDWKSFPVIPEISARALEIYRLGLELGNDPQRFSKVGDCQNVSSYFLSPFEFASAYDLGEYSTLQETIDWYKGSFSRDSLAVKGGFNVAAVLSPLRADPTKCEDGESPVQCELRLFNPSVAIVSMETWWSGDPGKYERYMRQLLDYLISEGVVPILATKADNLEGEHQINRELARLAWEYDIPLWNFWASLQDLSNKGLTEDGFHLTLGNYMYNDPNSTKTGWSRRNLTALQALDAFRRATESTP